MKTEMLDGKNKELWESFVENNPDTKIQHTLEFKEVVEKSYKNCEPLYYIHLDNNIVKDIFPFFMVKSRIFGDRVISQPFIDFGGPLGNFDVGFFSSVMGDIKKKLGKDLKHIEVRLNNFVPEYQKIEDALIKEGFSKELKRHQFILKLENEEILWNNFDRITRKGIKKAQKSGLVLKEIADETELKAFYDLYTRSMKNFGSPQHSYAFFLNIMNFMGKKFRGLNCYKDGNLIGSLIVFYSKNYMYAAYNFSEHGSLIYQPNDLLYWDMITWAVKNGIKYFDFGQCEINAEEGSHAAGIYKFKSKWNGTLYERPYFYYSFSEEKKDNSQEKEKFKKMIKIWKTLPSFLIKKVGPKIASELAL